MCCWLYHSRCDLEGIVFFFQAEDGIRDLVRSRGLGDVYKRQGLIFIGAFLGTQGPGTDIGYGVGAGVGLVGILGSVSYTHLTLPTSDLV